jgi:hypothetical protein
MFDDDEEHISSFVERVFLCFVALVFATLGAITALVAA